MTTMMISSSSDKLPHPCWPLTPYEEEVILQKLALLQRFQREGRDSSKDELWMRRLRRKLLVRRIQRGNGLHCWDLSTGTKHVGVRRPKSVVSSLVVANTPHEIKVSGFTARRLRPFIRRDWETKTQRMRLHEELMGKVWRSSPQDMVRHPIDFRYLDVRHVPAVNNLAAEFFWPGIDVSESLDHPDFSVVALYRQLVIGFAFLLPTASHTEAYLTFLFVRPGWRRCGLAKFFLYHLIQSCSGKDIVLHVSVNNPALMLYQSFGFKVEERISSFYDKYLPAHSKESRDALFLRLAR